MAYREAKVVVMRSIPDFSPSHHSACLRYGLMDDLHYHKVPTLLSQRPCFGLVHIAL